MSAISNATLAITSLQDNTANVSALTGSVDINLLAYSAVGGIATGTFGISDNTASATATGNTTAGLNGNLLEICALPTFNDSAAVTSLHSNTGAVAANSPNVSISATMSDPDPTLVHELQGNLTVDGNTVSTANTAVNSIRVADKFSLADDGAAGSVTIKVDNSVVVADLLVNSTQHNATGTTSAFTDAANIYAEVVSGN